MDTKRYGSSPRTWGTRTCSTGSASSGRFIPTYMGNTLERVYEFYEFLVHPHVHGEHIQPRGVPNLPVGSSPRTWGTPRSRMTMQGSCRFIPTYMGNTSARRSAWSPAPVHPHVHGEHRAKCSTDARSLGSSPRTWGTLHMQHFAPVRGWFIPTYMGNTRCRGRGSRHRSVHPHVHGEHFISISTSAAFAGSSPRTWGTLYRFRFIPEFDRFIPTYMGNTG